MESVATTADTGSTEELVVTVVPKLYEQLCDSTQQRVVLPSGVLLRLPLPLGECLIEDEIGSRYFGTSTDDYKRLCRNVAWDYPGGLALVNLDRARTLLFLGETFFEPQSTAITFALDWMLRNPGVFGLTVKKAKGGLAEVSLFAVLFHEEHGEAHLRVRAERLLREVRSWA